MRDSDHGKQMAEEMMMEPFLDSYPRLTGRTVEIISQGESPDFLALIDGRETGIELTKIHAETPDDYLDEFRQDGSSAHGSESRLTVI